MHEQLTFVYFFPYTSEAEEGATNVGMLPLAHLHLSLMRMEVQQRVKGNCSCEVEAREGKRR